MNSRRITTILFLAFLFFQPSNTFAQSLIGKWKRTSVIVVNKEGKSTEVQAAVEKNIPCSAGIRYEFTPGGMQKTIIPADCQKTMSAMANLFADTPYKLNGNKITIKTVDEKLVPDAMYTYQIKGDAMIWNFDYNQNSRTPNPTKAISMTITYKKQ